MNRRNFIGLLGGLLGGCLGLSKAKSMTERQVIWMGTPLRKHGEWWTQYMCEPNVVAERGDREMLPRPCRTEYGLQSKVSPKALKLLVDSEKLK